MWRARGKAGGDMARSQSPCLCPGASWRAAEGAAESESKGQVPSGWASELGAGERGLPSPPPTPRDWLPSTRQAGPKGSRDGGGETWVLAPVLPL